MTSKKCSTPSGKGKIQSGFRILRTLHNHSGGKKRSKSVIPGARFYAFRLSALYFKTADQSLTTRIKQWKGMLFSVHQAFVGRDERQVPLRMSAWEARVTYAMPATPANPPSNSRRTQSEECCVYSSFISKHLGTTSKPTPVTVTNLSQQKSDASKPFKNISIFLFCVLFLYLSVYFFIYSIQLVSQFSSQGPQVAKYTLEYNLFTYVIYFLLSKGDREHDCDEERGRKSQSLPLFAIMINLHNFTYNFTFSLAPRVARRTTVRGLLI